MAHNQIQYSEKYYDDIYEYRHAQLLRGTRRARRYRAARQRRATPAPPCPRRHVVLPQEIAQHLPKARLLSEVRAAQQLRSRRGRGARRTRAKRGT